MKTALSAWVNNLSLASKGLLLIVIVFGVQVIVILSYGLIVDRTDSLNTHQHHHKELIGRMNWLSTLIMTSALSSVAQTITGDPEYGEVFAKSTDSIDKELELLAPLVKDSAVETQGLLAIAEDWQKLKSRLPVSAHRASFEDLQALLDSGEMKVIWRKLFLDRRVILKEEATLFPVSIADLDSSRHLLKYLLNGVVLVDFLMAIFVFYIFIVEIVGRISTIADNSTRLAGGVPLNPPLVGCDEIQKLDGKFHEMAAQLAAARSELEASEKRIRTILGNVPTGVLVVQDARIEFGNVAAEKLFGITSADFQGANVTGLFQAADQDGSLSESVRISRNSSIELVGRRADGSTFRAEISSSVIVFSDGERTLLAVKDVTERYELERLKREFTSMVCHDLRNPLASIRLFHDMLANGYIGELRGPGPKLLANADRCTENLLALTNDMLELDRMDYASATSTDLVLSRLSLDTIVEKAVAFAEGTLSAKQIQVICAPSFLELQGDELKLLRVLGNLLTNAAKFSPEQSMIVIDIVSCAGMAKVSVTDKGRGIPASMQEAIFDKFKQVNLKDARIGSGLGLAICKKFVEGHGGKIGVVSQPGEGSTFWFTVPVLSPNENIAASADESLLATAKMSDDLQINPLGGTAMREQIGVR